MTRVSVKSSLLRGVGHQGEVLEVEFANGGVYRYTPVSAALFDELLKAESVGKFFNTRIKPGRECVKVITEQQAA